MSRHSDNAALAIADHKFWFGEPTGVEYRETPNCNWVTIANARVHGEFIGYVKKQNGTAKVTKRNVFCDASQVTSRVNAQVRINGDCAKIYTVTDITTRGDQVQLHLQRAEVVEVARDQYRRGQ